MKTRIKERRNELGITQSELHEKSGVSRTVISQLETNTRQVINTTTMVKIAHALDAKVEDIFLI